MVGSVQVYPAKRDYSTWTSTLIFWDVATGRELGRLAAPAAKQGYGAVCFPPQGNLLFTTLREGPTLKLCALDKTTFQVNKILPLREAPAGHSLAAYPFLASPDGKWLVLLSRVYPDKADESLTPYDVEQPQIHLFDARTGELKETLIAPPAFAASCCFSPDGKTLATAGQGKVLLWDLPAP